MSCELLTPHNWIHFLLIRSPLDRWHKGKDVSNIEGLYLRLSVMVNWGQNLEHPLGKCSRGAFADYSEAPCRNVRAWRGSLITRAIISKFKSSYQVNLWVNKAEQRLTPQQFRFALFLSTWQRKRLTTFKASSPLNQPPPNPLTMVCSSTFFQVIRISNSILMALYNRLWGLCGSSRPFPSVHHSLCLYLCYRRIDRADLCAADPLHEMVPCLGTHEPKGFLPGSRHPAVHHLHCRLAYMGPQEKQTKSPRVDRGACAGDREGVCRCGVWEEEIIHIC